eukprot:scaffold42054_cov63-Phaeocystis_antarctica.AAC.2
MASSRLASIMRKALRAPSTYGFPSRRQRRLGVGDLVSDNEVGRVQGVEVVEEVGDDGGAEARADVQQCEAAAGGQLQPEEDEGVHGEEVTQAGLPLYEPEEGQVAEREQDGGGCDAKRDGLRERRGVAIHEPVVGKAGQDAATKHNLLADTGEQREQRGDAECKGGLLELSEETLDDVVRREVERREERRL